MTINVLILLLLAGPADAQTPKPAVLEGPVQSRARYRVVGTVVVEATGRGLRYVALTFTGGLRTHTDNSGKYGRDQAHQGSVTVEATANGYLPERRDLYFHCSELIQKPGAPAPLCIQNLDFRMRPAVRADSSLSSCAVVGRTIDEESGSAVAGAQVVILGVRPVKGGNADGNGRFRIEGVAPGLHTVEARGIGFFKEARFLVGGCRAAADSVQLNFRLRQWVIR